MLFSLNVNATAIDTDGDTFDKMYGHCGYYVNGKTKYDSNCMDSVDKVWELRVKLKLEEFNSRLQALQESFDGEIK